MKLGAFRAKMTAAPIVEPESAIGSGGLVVIAPHPDDECLGATALLAGAARSRRPVGLVALTDGEASHPGSRDWPPARLAELRRGEQAAAMAALGCGDAPILRLGLPDSAAEHDPRFAAAAETVAAFCDRIGAGAIASTPAFEPHIDHHAAGLLLAAVGALRPHLRLLAYPVWTIRLGDDAEVAAEGMEPLRLKAPLAAKRAAIACHRSQLGLVVADDPAGFALPDWFLDHHDAPTEVLFRLR